MQAAPHVCSELSKFDIIIPGYKVTILYLLLLITLKEKFVGSVRSISDPTLRSVNMNPI